MHNIWLIALALIISLSSCCQRSKRNSSPQSISALEAQQAMLQERLALFKDGLSIYFASDSYAITNEGKQRMDSLLSALKSAPNAKLVLRGYADRKEKQALKLSMQRINAIKGILLKSNMIYENGIVIKEEALGDSDPLISYNTVNNNPQSRRVDVFITNQ